MRAALALLVATLILGLGHVPVLGQSGEDWLYSIHMFNELTGWAISAHGSGGVIAKGAVESVVRTTDGGLHWRVVTPRTPPGQKINGVAPNYDIDVVTPLIAWVSTTLDTPTLDTAVLFHTVNGGRTWKYVILPLFDSVDFINARDGWLLAGHDVYHSTDGGQTWAKVGSAKFAGQLPEMTFVSATSGWITAGGTNDPRWVSLSVTHDGGRTWQEQKLPLPPQLNPQFAATMRPRFFTAWDGVLPVFCSILNQTRSGLVVYMTHDGGNNWAYTTLPLLQQSWYHSASFADTNHGWVTDGGTLYVTGDGGLNWTKIQPSLPFGPLGELEFISPNLGWATGQALFSPLLLKTVDGGRTWAPVAYRVSR